jgi:hypothetical protein
MVVLSASTFFDLRRRRQDGREADTLCQTPTTPRTISRQSNFTWTSMTFAPALGILATIAVVSWFGNFGKSCSNPAPHLNPLNARFTHRSFNSSIAVSSVHEAQILFDAGMIHAFAFNQAAASALFRRAAQADPECSMCLWGQAYAAGPFVNRVRRQLAHCQVQVLPGSWLTPVQAFRIAKVTIV